jgi:hypothetical protein
MKLNKHIMLLVAAASTALALSSCDPRTEEEKVVDRERERREEYREKKEREFVDAVRHEAELPPRNYDRR